MVERYRLPEGFDAEFYRQSNPDLDQAIIAGVLPGATIKEKMEYHYKNFGGGESRPGSIAIPDQFLARTDSGTTVTPTSRQFGGSEIPGLGKTTDTGVGIDQGAVVNYMNANPDLIQDATEKGIYGGNPDGSTDSLELAKYAINHLTSRGYKEDRPLVLGQPSSAQNITGQNVVLPEPEQQPDQQPEQQPEQQPDQQPEQQPEQNTVTVTPPDPNRQFSFAELISTPDQSLTPEQIYIRNFYSSPVEVRRQLNLQQPNAQLPVDNYTPGVRTSEFIDTGLMVPAQPDPTRVFDTFQDLVNTPDRSLTDSQRYIRDFYSSTPEQRAALNVQNPNNQLPVAGYEVGVSPRPNIGDAALLPGTGGGATGGGATGGGATGGGATGGGTGSEDGDEEGPDFASILENLPGQIASGVETALENRFPEQPSSSSAGIMSPTVVGTATPPTDLSPVTEDIGDVQADTTAIRGDIGTPDATIDQPATLMGQTAGLAQGQTDITGRIGTAPTPDATLFGGQAGLAQDLTTAQQGITGIQAGIGEAPVDPTTGDPTTLFQGQAGLMTGQTGLSTAISGVGNQASAIGSDLTALTNQLRNFENLSNADRANILSTLNTRATELKDLANTYGLQTNKIAEQLTGVPAPTGMMAQAAPVAGSLPAILAAERVAERTTQNINKGLMEVAEQGQVGPLGPEIPDTRV